jgi:glycosyltransferase involved in cell wall biosynthesis
MRRAAAERLAPRDAILPVRRSDVLAADLSQPFDPAVPKLIPDEPVLVNWVTTPPSAGSGGHTTLFRIVRYLEAHGFLNRIYFYDVYRGDHRYYESIVRRYYGFHGPVARVEQGMPDAHAVFATSWQTAYPVFNTRCAGKRFYFVQDFEPFFYPTGSLSLLAENTYRMGFHAVTAGSWLAQKLSEEFGMCADFFQFGCDTSHYQRLENSRRSGVVFYARPEAARRGVELGLMAIESFARRRPDIQIHLYGQKMGRLPFSYVDHGRIGPDELNRIYNACYAGLSLSFTNVSLVPHEMLAAGCIPVVNDAMQNRMVLDNPFVRYVPPSAHALAAELEALVANSDFEALARAASGSVRLSSWQNAGASVVRIIENNLKRDISSLGHASGNRLSDGGVSYCPARL